MRHLILGTLVALLGASAAAADDPIFARCPATFRTLEWHRDGFELPAGATPLARSAQYPNQAFAWGRHGLALQCHAEVTARGLERWFISHAHEIDHALGLGVGQLRQDTLRYASRLQVRAATCWQPQVKGLTMMTNSQYNGWRFEDVWLEK